MLSFLPYRFEATWGWALQQLGFTQARCRNLSAVLAVPIDMTAAEVSRNCFQREGTARKLALMER